MTSKIRSLARNSMNSQEIIPTPIEKTGLLRNAPIRTKRLIVREFRLADCHDLYELHRDPKATRYAGGTRTKEQSFASLCRMINKLRQTGFGTMALENQSSEELIGWAGIQPLLGTQRYEILYALKQKYWGHGYATEAGATLLSAAFESSSDMLDRVDALVYPQNVGSIRVLEKLGFTFVEYYFDPPTQRYACLYSIIRATFSARYKEFSVSA